MFLYVGNDREGSVGMYYCDNWIDDFLQCYGYFKWCFDDIVEIMLMYWFYTYFGF